MQVRKLTVRDVFTLTAMLSKVKLPERSDDAQSYGLAVILAALRDVGPDMEAWLADMAQSPPDLFRDMAPTAIMDVVEGIISQEEARDFFGRLSKLLGGTSFSSGLAGQTTKSDG